MTKYNSVLEMMKDIGDPSTVEKFEEEVRNRKLDLSHEIFNEWSKAKFHMEHVERLIKSKIRSALDVVFDENQNLDSIIVRLIPAKSKFSSKMCFDPEGELNRSSRQVAKLLKKEFEDSTHSIALEIFESKMFIKVRRSDLKL